MDYKSLFLFCCEESFPLFIAELISVFPVLIYTVAPASVARLSDSDIFNPLQVEFKEEKDF